MNLFISSCSMIIYGLFCYFMGRKSMVMPDVKQRLMNLHEQDILQQQQIWAIDAYFNALESQQLPLTNDEAIERMFRSKGRAKFFNCRTVPPEDDTLH